MSGLEFLYSDDESELFDTDDWLAYKLPFGQRRGQTLGTLIQTRESRLYLRRLVGLDNLDAQVSDYVNRALKEYNHAKKNKSSTKAV